MAELRPLLDVLVAASRPDPARRWSASGELGTVGERIVEPGEVAEGMSELTEAEARRLGRLYRRTAELVKALAAGRHADAADLLLDQGEAEEEAGDAGAAEAWYRAAHRLARRTGSRRAPEALRKAARAARSRGRLDEAARAYEEAWEEAGVLDRDRDRVVAAIGRGNVSVDRGRWDDAEAWYERALEVLGGDGRPRRERWQILQNLAIVHRRRGDLAAARRSLRAAEAEARALDDPAAAVEVGNGWGQLLLAEGDLRAAELHLREALELATRPKARVTVGVNLGEVLLAGGRALEAGEVARAAEAEAVAGEVAEKLPEVYRLLAAVARERGESDAFVVLERALRLVEEHQLPPFEEAQTLEAYGKLRLRNGERDAGGSALSRAAAIYAGLGMEARGADLRRRAEERESEPDDDDRGGEDEPLPDAEGETKP